MKTLLAMLSILTAIHTSPIRKIPQELYDAFTEGGSIKVVDYYCDDTYSSDVPIKWSMGEISAFTKRIQNEGVSYYGVTDQWVYQALKKYSIEGKTVGVIGSVTPWYESVVLHFKGIPTTIEYNTIDCEDDRIEVMTVEEYNANPKKFDVLISISSIEHDGLGRYGDPIDPYGDYKAMSKFKMMLNPGGLLYLAVPVTEDSICFNAHRTYGKIRLPKLLSGWTIQDSFGYSTKDYKRSCSNCGHQPVFVLKPVES